MKRSKNSELFIGALIIFCFILMFVSFKQKQFRSQLNEVQMLPYKGVSVETLSDGFYTGKTDVSFLSLELKIQVENKTYKNIEIVTCAGSRGEHIPGFVDELVSTGKVTVPSKKGPLLEYLVFISCLDQATKE